MTSLKERVERNAAVWLLGSLFVGFSTGIATYKGIQEMAGLTVLSPKDHDDYKAAEQRVVELEEALKDVSAQNDELTRELDTAREQGATEARDKLTAARLDLETEKRIRERLEAELAELRATDGSEPFQGSRLVSDQGDASNEIRTIVEPGQFKLGPEKKSVLLTAAGVLLTVSGQPNSGALYVALDEQNSVHLDQGRSLPLAGTGCRVRLLDVNSRSGHVFDLRCE